MAGFNRDYDKALTQRQKAERDAAREAIRSQYDAMGREADDNFDRQIAALRQQQVEAYPDKAKQEQIGAQIGNIESQKKAAKKARDAEKSKEMSKTDDLSQYGKGYDYNSFKQEEAQKAQERQDRMDRITSSLGGYFGGKKKDTSSDGEEVVEYNPSMFTKDPNAPFNDVNLTGDDGSKKMNLGTFGSIPLTDEQSAQVEKDNKEKEDANTRESQEKTGGAGFDSDRLQQSVDEDGNPTFAKRNENPDLTYHPAIEASQAIKRPKDEADSDKWDDYRTAFGLGRYLSQRLHANDKDPMGRSGRLRRQAEMHDIEAGDHQRAMQQNLQISNRDYRSEAEKNAASQAAAENAQKIHNLGNAGAGAAALERDVKSADYNTMMQRSDQQRAEGIKNLEKMHDDRQVAEEERSGADVYDYTARDMNDYNARSGFLSMGGRQSDKKNRKQSPKIEERIPVETKASEPPETESESEYVNNVSHQDLLNACMSKWYDKVKEKYPNVPENNNLMGMDWKEISRRPDHTLSNDPSLDVPEYHEAVEELAQKLWNGEPVTVDGETYGGTDKNGNPLVGPDAVYDLYMGRGGDKGDVERLKNPEKWKSQNTGALNVEQE